MQGGKSMQPLWNTLFWVSIALLAVVVFHVLLRALVIWRRMRMPAILHYPRLELIVLLTFLPVVAASAARERMMWLLARCSIGL